MATNTSSMSETLECTVCLQTYNESDRLPKALTCLHTICGQCVNQLKSHASIRCPTCRKDSDIVKVTVNFAVTDFIRALCHVCMGRNHKRKCGHCHQDLCDQCLEEHSKTYHKELLVKLAALDAEVTRALNIYGDNSVIEKEHQRESDALREIRSEMQRRRDEIDAMEKKLEMDVTTTKKTNIDKHTKWNKSLLNEITSAKDFSNDTKGKIGIHYGKQTSLDKMIEIDVKHNEVLSKMTSLLKKSPKLDSYSTCPMDAPLEKPRRGPEHGVPDYTTIRYKCSSGSEGCELDQFNLVVDAVCTGNMVIVADERNHRLKWYDCELNALFDIGSKGSANDKFSNPCGLAVGQNNEIFVSDLNNHRIVVLSKNGEYRNQFFKKGSGDNEIDKPQGIVISGNDLFICDSYNYRVKHVKTDGTFIRHIGSKGTSPGQFEERPVRIAVMSPSDGRILVKVLKKVHLQVYDSNGKYLGLFPDNVPSQVGSAPPNDVCVDVYDNVLVAYASGKIGVYDKSGTIIKVVGTKGTGPSELLMPSGVRSNTKYGFVIVCDKKGNKIVKFEFDKK